MANMTFKADLLPNSDYGYSLGSATSSQMKRWIVPGTTVETIIGTQTGNTGSWTGTSKTIKNLYDGLTIRYFLPYSPSGNATLNLTLADGTTTGAINCYYAEGRLTTHYGRGSVITLTYFSAGSIKVNGTATTDNRWIADANYADGNDVNVSRITYPRLKTGAVGIGRYSLFMETSDGTYQSITSTFNSTGTSHVKNTAKFKLGRVYYSNRGSDIAANTTVGDNSWVDQQTGLIDLRYSTNCGTTLTSYKPVYLVGTIGTDGYFTLTDTWYTQTEPTSEDGKAYIYLGMVYPDTNPYRVAFEIDNPVYWYKNNGFRLYGSGRGISGITRSGTTFTVTRDDGSTFTFTQQDNNTWRGIQDNLTSDSATDSLSAKQGKALANGSARDSTKLPLAGGTMTGVLTVKGNMYSDAFDGALNMNNSDIYGANSIYTADSADGAAEGLHFYRDSTHVDTLWVSGGNIYFVPNRAIGTNTTAANSQKVGRFTANPTTGQVVITDGTTGGIKSSGYTIAKSVPSDAVFTDTNNAVTQTNQTGANDYRILLSGSADDTTKTEGSNKSTNLRFNPSTKVFSVGGDINATGDLTLTGNANLNSETYAESITAGSLLVNGAANFVNIPTAPTPVATSNDTSIATTAFVMNAFTANDAMVFKGVINANSALPAGHKQGWTYRIGTAGTYANKVCEVGDIIICVTEGTSANNDHWAVIQNNIDGAVYKGTNAFTDAHVIVADSTAGKVKDSGKTITATAPSSSAADTTIPTSKAVWSAISGASGYGKTGTVTSITAGAGLNTTSNDTATDGGSITSSGTLYLTKSGVTAGSYGPSAAVTGNEGTTMDVPYITVDKYGRVTSISNKTYTAKNTTYTFTAGTSTLAWNSEVTLATVGGLAIKAKLPANPNTNTDTLVKQTAKTDNVNYKLLGTTSASPSSGTAMEATYSANIYANPSTGAVSAVRHTLNVGGTDKAYMAFNSTTNAIDFIFV